MKSTNVPLMLCCCSMACLTACQKAGEDVSGSEKLYMSVVARIGDMGEKAGTRYAGTDVDNVSFGEGDAMGIFVDGGTPTLWNFAGLGWTADGKTYWPDKNQEHAFQAYSPCTSTAGALVDKVPMPALEQQSGAFDDLDKCDFLVAETNQSYGENGVVEFKGEGKSFRHVSSLIHLTIEGTGDLANATLNRIAIGGTDVATSSTYSFETGEVTLLTTGSKDQITTTGLEHAMNGKNADFYFILNEKEEGNALTLTIDYVSKDNKKYTATKEFATSALAGGTKYTCKVIVRDSSLTVSGGEISPWADGGEMGDVVIDAEGKDNV